MNHNENVNEKKKSLFVPNHNGNNSHQTSILYYHFFYFSVHSTTISDSRFIKYEKEQKKLSRELSTLFPSDFSCLSICPSTKTDENYSDGTYQVENGK